MNIWANAVITTKGLALQSKLTQGHTLNITRAVAGAGYVAPALLAQQTAVTDPMQTLSFKTVSYPEEGKCTMPVSLTNEGLAEGYMAMQVGIYATDPDEGEILYFIAGAPNAQKGTEVPSETEAPGYSAEWTFYFQYGQADGVTVVVDPSNSVSQKELEAYIESEFVAITHAEIDALLSIPAAGGESGETGDGGSTVVGTYDHSVLYNRDAADQHPIESITGLEDALTAAEGTTLSTLDVETAWNEATTNATNQQI